ncbi:hypothetical protein ACFQ9X_25205 [Catenulispora yoronensis]
MLVQTGGRERTIEEYGDLLTAGGFAITSVRPITGSYFSVIEAEPTVAR